MKAYLITNLVTGKKYVGITAQSIKRRWNNHRAAASCGGQTSLCRSIRKHGESNFVVSHIASGLSVKGLLEAEVFLIKQHGTRLPGGYNMTDGGDGAHGLRHSAESRAKIGTASRMRARTDQMRRKISEARKGKPLSLEHRLKLSAAKFGKKMGVRSKAHRQGISDGLTRAWARRKASNV